MSLTNCLWNVKTSEYFIVSNVECATLCDICHHYYFTVYYCSLSLRCKESCLVFNVIYHPRNFNKMLTMKTKPLYVLNVIVPFFFISVFFWGRIHERS